MPTSQPNPLRGRRRWLLLPLPMLAIAFGAARCWGNPAPTTNEPPAAESGAVPSAVRLQADAAGTEQPTSDTNRTSALPAAPTQPLPDFAQLVEQLTIVGETTANLLQGDEIEAARSSDAEARQRFDELLEQFEDAGERAIDLATSLGDSTASHETAKRFVLQLTLAAECARRAVAAESAQDYGRIDPLVHALLAVMPQNGELAKLGASVLDKRPFLRLSHESAVLQLVDLAGKEQFDRPIATGLLLTLWNNLQSSGERTTSELASLAMVLLADGDQSKRTAACRQLLCDARYRHVMLAWLRERADVAVASEVAGMAAQQLPADEALAVLRELGPVVSNMPNAYMALGFRAPEALGDTYRELLAANTNAAVRSDLIAGLAMADAALAMPAVELAQNSDPAPAVRVQAMLTLTATAAATHGEQACQRALDDPAIGNDPAKLAIVLFGLQNLEAAGLTNAVDRLGQRMRATPLREDTRLQLEQLLARALPGGQTSDQQSRGGIHGARHAGTGR
jgi:hypothetical protein